jgi:hypothetical protein
MNELDDNPPQEPQEPSSDALGAQQEPEIAEDDEPGALDLLKAAKDGAQELRKQEP